MAIGSNLNTNTETVWYCKLLETTPVTFAAPVEMQMIINPLSGDAAVTIYGATFNEYLQTTLPREESEKFFVKDRFYIYKKPPKTHDLLQTKSDGANYEITIPPLFTLNLGTLRFKKLANK